MRSVSKQCPVECILLNEVLVCEMQERPLRGLEGSVSSSMTCQHDVRKEDREHLRKASIYPRIMVYPG